MMKAGKKSVALGRALLTFSADFSKAKEGERKLSVLGFRLV
jgi:hypothetical protein